MSEANWTSPGETLSHKNACKEFDLEEDVVIEAMKKGILQYRVNYAHGNPYYRLLRNEVIALAKEIHGENTLELKRIEFEIKTTTTEINSYKRKISALEKKKIKLINQRDAIDSENK